MFQPQPEPPGKTAIEMSVSTAKGSGSGMMSLYDKDSARTMLSAGLVQLSHPNNTDLPGAWLSTDSSQSQFNMRGVQPPMGGEPGVISMVARSDSAKVGIGTNTPSEALHVVGNILATGTVTAMTSTKYKSNISDINNALDRITRLHGVTFNWNREDYAEMKFPTKRQVGFLAEEVNDIVPEVVLEDKDGPLAVDYGRLTAVLVEAVKELKAENEELRQRIELLELR
jgi:hypothetical protein